MTATTIKVSTELRGRLRKAAAAQGHTLGEHIAALLDEEDRRLRFAQLREQMAACPPDEQYLREAREWQSDAWS